MVCTKYLKTCLLFNLANFCKTNAKQLILNKLKLRYSKKKFRKKSF